MTDGTGTRTPEMVTTILVASAVPFAGFYQGLASFSLSPSWKTRLGLTDVELSLIWLCYIVGVVLALVVAPRLARTCGTRRVLGAGLLCGLTASVVLAMSGHTLATCLGRFLSGLTTGMSASVGVASVLSLGRGHLRTFAVSSAAGATSLGGGVGAVASGFIGKVTDRPDVAIYLIAALIVVLGFVCLARTTYAVETGRQGPVDPADVADPIQPVRVAGAVALSVVGGTPMGVLLAMGPVIMRSIVGSGGTLLVGSLAVMMFGGGFVGQLLAARTQLSRRRPWALFFSIGSCVLLAFAVAVGWSGVMVMGALFTGFGSGYAQLVVFTELRRGLIGSALARATALTFLFSYATNGSLPLVLGRISDVTGGYGLALVLLTVVIGVLAGVSVWLWERRPSRAVLAISP